MRPTAFAVLIFMSSNAFAQHEERGPGNREQGGHDNRPAPQQSERRPGNAEHRPEEHRPEPPRPEDHRPEPGRVDERRSEAARPGYDGHRDFREDDRQRLQRHYAKLLPTVDRQHRPEFRPGAPIPDGYRGHFTPPPVTLIRRLPPPPEGCQYGYYQGYVVTYNPSTFVIAAVIDLIADAAINR